ncbi:hypothetical protein GW750_00810 [bacterium]|nr:hypothetical protein [bacterium]
MENLHLDISQLTTMYVADDDAIKKMLEDLETMEDKNDVDFQKESVV